jgi:hypothetical protein
LGWNTNQTDGGPGVVGVANDVHGGAGVLGCAWGDHPEYGALSNDAAQGVNAGVVGINNHTGQAGQGVFGVGGLVGGEGVRGVSRSVDPAVAGHSQGGGPAVAGYAGTGFAGFFVGKVSISELLLGGDTLAIRLPSAGHSIAGGFVLVFDEHGRVQACATEYDPAVAGVAPGLYPESTTYHGPALTLGEQDPNYGTVVPGTNNVAPAHVVVLGTAWCFADATSVPIRPGDLLTTSARLGYCQRLTDPTKALGTVVGRALTPLPSGTSAVRVLVSPR